MFVFQTWTEKKVQELKRNITKTKIPENNLIKTFHKIKGLNDFNKQSKPYLTI